MLSARSRSALPLAKSVSGPAQHKAGKSCATTQFRLTPDAGEMTEEDWEFPNGSSLTYVLAPIKRGTPSVFVVVNAAAAAIEVTLPDVLEGGAWTRVLDTTSETLSRRAIAAGTRLTAPERSVLVFSGRVPRVARLWRRSSRPTRPRPGSGA